MELHNGAKDIMNDDPAVVKEFHPWSSAAVQNRNFITVHLDDDIIDFGSMEGSQKVFHGIESRLAHTKGRTTLRSAERARRQPGFHVPPAEDDTSIRVRWIQRDVDAVPGVKADP